MEKRATQTIVWGIDKLQQILEGFHCHKVFMVVDSSYPFLNVKQTINSLKVEKVFFSGFTPNPLYEQVVQGLDLLKSENCDSILAIGGGSAIDVAKCIKLAYISPEGPSALIAPAVTTANVTVAAPTCSPTSVNAQAFTSAGTPCASNSVTTASATACPNNPTSNQEATSTCLSATAGPLAPTSQKATAYHNLPLFAVPTTAGTGSESTHNAVVYYKGAKQTVTSEQILPSVAILEPSVLKTLPLYQKKCTLMDALCQAIESWWSVNSTPESKLYSQKAIELICSNWKDYIFTNKAAEQIMLAANYAGRAINLAQTTAAHAMSYKITSLYNLPHGHAVALCLPAIWEYMIEHLSLCADPRGPEYLSDCFTKIASTMLAGTCPDRTTSVSSKPCLAPNEHINSAVQEAMASSALCNVSDNSPSTVPAPAPAEKANTSVKSAVPHKLGIEEFNDILNQLELSYPNVKIKDGDIDLLASSVNPIRLKNNPIPLSTDTCRELYKTILCK